jgi:hypothetical protein
LGYVAELFPEGTGGPPGTANATNATASAVGKGLRIGGAALIVVSVTWEAVQVYNSDNPARAGTGAVGAYGAGLVSGLVVGAAYGAAWGTFVPGPGNVVGGVVGGLVGLAVTGYASYVGSGYGRQFGYDVYDAVSEHMSPGTN